LVEANSTEKGNYRASFNSNLNLWIFQNCYAWLDVTASAWLYAGQSWVDLHDEKAKATTNRSIEKTTAFFI